MGYHQAHPVGKGNVRMAEEHRMILRMVAEKKISPEEGAQLLRRLEPIPQQNDLVEPDAVNLLRLGFEALAEQVQMLRGEPSLNSKLADLKDRTAEARQAVSAPPIETEVPDRSRTERMKSALAELIQRAEELNTSLDDALAGRKRNE